MDTIELRAYAKINLALDVTGTRPNGYHDVKMIMQTVGLFDRLTLRPIAKNEIVLSSNLSFLPTGKDNLVYRAAAAFFEEMGEEHGVAIELEKHIPVAAGMAGGSTDAAATLIGLNEMYGTGYSLEKLQQIGVKLGADIPYCLMGKTALAEGIGEILTPLPAPPACQVLVVKPGISVSTKAVYDHLVLDENTVHPDVDGMIEAIKFKDYKGVVNRLGNVLEDVTCELHPIIKDIKSKMLELGVDGSLMSGSGPTVFGLFSDPEKARKAYYEFKTGDFGQTFLTEYVN